MLPVYNELAALDELLDGITHAFDLTPHSYEIIFVNDGSSDGSATRIDEYTRINPRVRTIHFSRNFGHQAALHAGLAASRGDAVIVMDSDLQDDPAAIPRLIVAWEAGYDIVYAIRKKRKEQLLKRLLFYSFYRVMSRVAAIQIPSDAGNFGLIDRRAADHIAGLAEVSRFYPGLRSWVGFRQTGIEVERGERHDDNPRVSPYGLVRLARTAVFSFSSAPLTLFYAVALLSCIVCFALTGFTLYQKLNGDASPGWASGLITASFFGMLNALGIAVLGEYVVRIFDQVRNRPQFIVDRTVNLHSHPENTVTDPLVPEDRYTRPSQASRPQQHTPYEAVINDVNS
ncbi:MAG: glycosyltransferase family 2 protein [Planctomycetes bacterium]|nr:glycosyltransferase family 2 protein [Planctomycetota bacterium]